MSLNFGLKRISDGELPIVPLPDGNGSVGRLIALFNRICKGHPSDNLYIALDVPFVRFYAGISTLYR